jgi:hypothetical protein
MKCKKEFFGVLLTASLAIGCSGRTEHLELRKASEVHREAVGIALKIRDFLKHDTIDHTDSIRVWRKLADDWERDLVEVLGDHGDDHSQHGHHHKASVNLAPAEMLAVQRAMKEQIERLQKRIIDGSKY